MAKSKIEWTNYSINPVKGLCPMACPYCYARRMYKRFKWNPEIRFENPELPKQPSRIFVGSTMELFGPWVKDEWLKLIFTGVRCCPQHTFIFLTKQPQNLANWTFPENCWVGVSATDDKTFTEACVHLQQIKASVKFISIEPLLAHIGDFHYLPLLMQGTLQWLIIGQRTPVRASTSPKIEWLKEIVEAADKAAIPVFLKNNLRPLIDSSLDDIGPVAPFYKRDFCDVWEYRQEFPKE